MSGQTHLLTGIRTPATPFTRQELVTSPPNYTRFLFENIEKLENPAKAKPWNEAKGDLNQTQDTNKAPQTKRLTGKMKLIYLR